MLATGLHSLGRYGPHSGLEIHLAPSRQPSLSGSRRGQDRGLQQQLGCCPRVGRSYPGKRSSHVSMMQRSPVSPHSGAVLRQRLRYRVTGRIVAPMAGPDRPPHNRPDSMPQPPCRLLPSIVPDRSKHGEHIGAGNVADRFPPIAGETNCRNDERQTSTVNGLRHVPARISITISAALSKVGVVDRIRGSRPWYTARAFSSAASRASTRATIGNGPSPMLQGLPLMRSRWLHHFAQPPWARGFTRRLKPCPPWPSP